MPQLNWLVPFGSVLSLSTARLGYAEVAVFSGDGAAWFHAVPAHDTINFTEFPNNTPIGEQYARMGVHFSDTDGNWIISSTPATYPQDGCGLNGNAIVQLSFDQPMSAFASQFPGISFYSLYLGDIQIFSSALMGGTGTNHFAGFTSDAAFDRVVIHGLPPNPFGVFDQVFFDNFYFSTVPAPGALGLFVAIGPWPRSRGRHR